jgi:chromosome segregation ATPase
LQNQHRTGKDKGINGMTESAVQEKEQFDAQDELLALRKYCSDLQEENLSLTQERDALRTERNTLKADFDKCRNKDSARIDNLNVITEERDDLQKNRDKLMDQEGSVKVILEKILSLEKAHLILSQERDNLRLEHEELKIHFEQLVRDSFTLKHNLNVMRERCDGLQNDRDKLLQLEGGLKEKLKKLSSIQEAHCLLTQERDILRSEHKELQVNFEKLKRECSALRNNLNTIRQKFNPLQRTKNLLQGIEAKIKMMDEESIIQNCILTQERDTLRSEYEKLKVSFYKLKQENISMKEDLNVVREEHDALQKDKGNLVYLEGGMKKMLEELLNIQEAHFILTRERETLRSDHEELRVNFEELVGECRIQKFHFNSITEKGDALQREKEKLVSFQGRNKIMLDERLSFEMAYLTLPQK